MVRLHHADAVQPLGLKGNHRLIHQRYRRHRENNAVGLSARPLGDLRSYEGLAPARRKLADDAAVSRAPARYLAEQAVDAGWRREDDGERICHQNPIGSAKKHRIWRSEEQTSELQSLMRISYAVFCLKKKKKII